MKRKFIAGLMALLMLVSPIRAGALDVVVSKGDAVAGEAVVVEVRLTEEVTTKSGSIELIFDPEVMVVESYTWHLQGALIQFFDPATGQGAFACMQPIEIGDLIFTVVFRVSEQAEYGESDITVNMGFTNSDNPDDDVKVEDVPGDMYVGCGNHDFAEPTCTEPSLCTICGADTGEALGHSFGETVVHKPTPDTMGFSEHTCQVCGHYEQFDFKEFHGVTISGTITSYLEEDYVTVELIQDGQVVAGGAILTADYAIENVEAGEYILRFGKANHATREYQITVGEEDVVLNAQICPKGDVTNDGVVNVKDFQRLLRHVNKTNLLTDYALACGDVTGDDNCNVKDFQRLLRHVNKTNPLY